MQSQNNLTTTPLLFGQKFIGILDDVIIYDTANYTINSDTNCQLNFFHSDDQINFTVSTFNYIASGFPVTKEILLKKYIYVTIKNYTKVDQTILSFVIEYKLIGHVEFPLSFQNVIVESSVLPLGASTSANQISVLNAINNLSSSSSSSNHVVLWNNLLLTQVNQKSNIYTNVNSINYYIYGNSSIPTFLTVEASLDNLSWYTSSQFSINVVGNFGYSISNVSVPYLRFNSSNITTITLISSAF